MHWRNKGVTRVRNRRDNRLPDTKPPQGGLPLSEHLHTASVLIPERPATDRAQPYGEI